MRDYVITVNSTVDVPKLWLEERHVPVVALKYTIDGETYTDMEGLTAKEFFEKLREGKMSVTSQVNPEEAMEALEPFVKEGKDILHLGFSSGLSGTLNSMRLAGEMLEEKYPEAKVIVSAFPETLILLLIGCISSFFTTPPESVKVCVLIYPL